MYEKVKSYISENRMIEPGSTVIAGVSGGGDSMVMLDLLRRFRLEVPYDLYVVHVHHGIRGKEADRDRTLVENMCEKWKIPCKTYCYDVPALSKEWKLGEEETGRLVRKEAFEQERIRIGAAKESLRIALAHNENDLAETMLHHLARGTGLRGLSTMSPVTGSIIRPVLCLDREEIAHYLEETKTPHIVDSSNLCDDYTRNRIRHHILPLLEQEVNLRTAAHMAETSRVIAQAQDYLSRQGEALLGKYEVREDPDVGDGASEKPEGTAVGYLLSPGFFQEEPILQSYAIQTAFEKLSGKRKDFTSVHVRQVLELRARRTGRKINLPYGLTAEKTYDGIRLRTAGESLGTGKMAVSDEEKGQNCWAIPTPGTLTCPLGTFYAKIFSYEGQKIEEKTYTKWLDYDTIKDNLCIRTRQTGDYLVLNEEGSRKKLNRCMIDMKIPREQRDRVPLAAIGSEVVWMVGGRINDRYKITSRTGRVLELQYQGGKIS